MTSVGGVATGVPTDATGVVLEYNVDPNFSGYLSSGASASPQETSMRFTANAERNGFDVVKPSATGQVTVTVNGTVSSTASTYLVVRLHGYFTGASATSPGSTFVGSVPTKLYDSDDGGVPLPLGAPSTTTVPVTGWPASPPTGPLPVWRCRSM